MWIHKIYWLMSYHQYLDTVQVSSLSDEYNLKLHFIKARPGGRFYENLAYIELIIDSELSTMKKFLRPVSAHTWN